MRWAERLVQTVEGLCIEQRCATDAAKAHLAAGNALEAGIATGKAAGLARACSVLSRVLREVVDA